MRAQLLTYVPVSSCVKDKCCDFRACAPAQQVYQTPEQVHKRASVAVLFLAHGCSHAATDFFDKGTQCARCIGLPIERRIVRESLKRGYTVVAISSIDREGSKCWHPDFDAPRISRGLEFVAETARLGRLPIVALGASSGGRMVHELAASDLPESLAAPGRTRLAAAAVQIMPIPVGDVDDKYPPTILWHMPRDEVCRLERKLGVVGRGSGVRGQGSGCRL